MLINVDNVNKPSPTSGFVIFSKTYMTHVLHPIFQEESIENCLRYVRGLKVMLIDVDNVNQAIHVFDDFDELAVVLPLAVFVDDDMGVHDAKSGSNLV